MVTRLLALAAGGLVATLLAGAVAARPAPVPHVAHVVVVVFENRERGAVMGVAPTFDALAARYAQATDYHAVAHPSLPNYLALVSGSTHGVTDDCTDCPQTGATIGTQLTRLGKRWGAFAEGYPDGARFAKKHVPFLYFAADMSHVHPLTAFHANALPAFSFVVPDLCDDMHDCSVATGDAWLHRFVRPLLARPSTLVFVVFDEGTTDVGGGGLVPLIVAGDTVRRHGVARQPATHYTLLRTIEDALGLAPLGAAKQSAPLSGVWR